jgi:tetratricopeptide (TPR) repeat protein
MEMRDIRVLWAVIVLVASPFAVAGAELPSLPKLNMADFQPAIRKQVQQADTIARAHPRSAEASGKLGMVLDAYQQYESAALCYERARRIDARSFAWAYYLGSVKLHQGKYDQAAATLREALRMRPDYLPAQFKLAESQLAAGDLDGSGKVYEAILKSDPDSAEALYGMGRIQAARGDSASAAEFLRRACEQFPAYGAAQYALAMAYQRLGKPDEAEPHFRAYKANVTGTPPLRDELMGAVQELDLGAQTHLRRSLELEQQGRLAEAIDEQELALQADPKNVQANINLISLYARVGQPEKAEQCFQTAVRLNPDRADAYYDHGVLLYTQGKYQEAEQAYRQALKINPYYAESHNNLGVLLEKQGQTEAAMEEYRAAIKNQPGYRLAHYHIATIFVRQGKYSEAIASLLKTLQPEDASTPGYIYALAIAYARGGDRANALKYARQARDLATAWHQTQLVSRIDQDIHGLEQEGPTP